MKYGKLIAGLGFYAVTGLGILPPIAYVVNGILDNKISIKSILEQDSLFNFYLDLLFNGNVFSSYFVFNPINAAFWGLIGYGLLMLLFSLIKPKRKNKYDKKDQYASHGSARWQEKEEIKEHYYEGPREGWFLGSDTQTHFELGKNYAVHAINNKGKLNAQINVVGPPGSDKTTGFVYPNLFNVPDSYKNSKEKPDIIVTDPKGELLAYTGNYLKDCNYEIKIIDFLHLKYGDAVNPLSYIEEEIDIFKVATGFVNAAGGNTEGGPKTGDPIWDNGEALLLGALIAFVREVYPPEEQTFEKVGLILGSDNIRDFERAERLFKNHGITGYAEELWNKFLNLEDKLRSGVVGGLSIKMTIFSLTRVKKITGTNSFDFRDLGREKDKPLAVFIQMPDEDRTYAPIINTMVSMMLKTMYSTARETFSKLPNPVYMILEEIANIGKIPGIEDLLGTMRGRRIYPMMIWQDLVQMKKIFGDSWEGIVAKCDTQVYLGVNDQFTAKYISEKLGKSTIETDGESENNSGGLFMPSKKTISKNYSQRSLLFPDEVERFDNEKFFTIQRSRQPVILYKTQYKHWEKGKMIAKPLDLTDLPLIDRLYEEESIQPVIQKDTKIEEKTDAHDHLVNITTNEQWYVDEEIEKEVITNNHDHLVNITIDEHQYVEENNNELEEFDIPVLNENDIDLPGPSDFEIEEEFTFDFEEETGTEKELVMPKSQLD